METTNHVTPETARPPQVEEIDPFVLITSQDIKASLPSAGSAAGPHGFTGRDLRACPMIVLQVALNLLILQGRLPTCLQGARTTFIPKKNIASKPEDFRPITVASILVRTLHKILAKRIMLFVDLDFRQRAFISTDGCAENLTILASVLHDAKTRFRPQYMPSVDIAKAFDRVTKQAILNGARRKGLSETFISYIDFYDTSSTILTFNGHTALARPGRGVRQGDPLRLYCLT